MPKEGKYYITKKGQDLSVLLYKEREELLETLNSKYPRGVEYPDDEGNYLYTLRSRIYLLDSLKDGPMDFSSGFENTGFPDSLIEHLESKKFIRFIPSNQELR